MESVAGVVVGGLIGALLVRLSVRLGFRYGWREGVRTGYDYAKSGMSRAEVVELMDKKTPSSYKQCDEMKRVKTGV